MVIVQFSFSFAGEGMGGRGGGGEFQVVCPAGERGCNRGHTPGFPIDAEVEVFTHKNRKIELKFMRRCDAQFCALIF